VLLIGMLDSPFVRRVAVSMQLLDIGYEHANWSVGRDFDRIRAYNPLGRVPTLVLDDGEVLCESAVILDHLDERVGAARALLPAAGSARREALRQMAMAIGAAEKGREQIYERAFRPPTSSTSLGSSAVAARCMAASPNWNVTARRAAHGHG
jgi:glutathione S-transferase